MFADRTAEHDQFGIVDRMHSRHGDDQGLADGVDPHGGRRILGLREIQHRAHRSDVERRTVRATEALADQCLQHSP